MPKVSIIIPTYNVDKYLRECMESVVRQTLSDIQIVCVNDGSTDNSLSILQEYAAKDSRIVLIDQPNGGYGKAMNAGIDRAEGEYVGIVEPDDYVKLTMFEDLYNIASENELDFVKADHYRFWYDEKTNDLVMRYIALSDRKSDYNKVFNPGEFPRGCDFVMNTWSGIYRRDFLTENNIRHNETPGASFQDIGFFFQTWCFASRGMIVDQDYYRVRRDNPDSSVKNPGKVYAANKEYDHVRDILMEHPVLWNRFKYMYWKKRFNSYIFTLKRIGPQFKHEYIHYISKELARVNAAGLLREKEFGPELWELLQLILRDPDGYLPVLLSEKGTLVQDIMNSSSYKLGFAITSVPRKIKNKLKGTR